MTSFVTYRSYSINNFKKKILFKILDMNIEVHLKMNCPYTNELIHNVLKEENGLFTVINHSTSNSDNILYWLEYEDIDFEMLYRLTKESNERKFLANSYCIRKGLLRKAHFALFIKKYLSKVK